MKIYTSITEIIGNTPLIELKNTEKNIGLKAKIVVKAESFNPGGSVKDRIAKAMIEDAEKKGIINKNTVIIEPTSGNTGVGIASIAAAKGYKVILTMPETMSIERRKLLSAYGAQIVLTESTRGMRGAIAKANELAQEHKNSIILSQFTNKANPNAHYMSTGPEIWEDTDGKVDIFVSGAGTGGTVTGTGTYLKEKNKEVKVYAVEPESSPVLSGGNAGPHKIQGIGAGFIPEVLNMNIIDGVIKVKDEDALETGRKLASQEGILAGISSGAAVWAAVELAKKEENAGKLIVAVLPDTGERYLSTALFA